MPSALHLRSSLRESARTLLNWSRTRNWSQIQRLRPHKHGAWRRRVEVESTIRPAKGRIAGFEGREGHRTPFASVAVRSSGFRLYSTYSNCGSSATGCAGRERFPAERLTAFWQPRGFLQGLKPTGFGSFAPGLKPRPPKEETFSARCARRSG